VNELWPDMRYSALEGITNDRWGRPRGITENPGTNHQRTLRLAYHPALDRITQAIASAPNGEKTTDLSYDDHGDLLYANSGDTIHNSTCL